MTHQPPKGTPDEKGGISKPATSGGATARTTAPSDKLSQSQLIAFGVGGLPYSLGVDALKQLAKPIYNILLGVNPAWIGTVLMVARIWDAITDPMMGIISDNTRTRWGRRRPYIAVGAVLCAITFPLVWFAPMGMSQAFTGGYFLVTSLLFYTSFTLFSVPYMTLALELTPSHHERTKVLAYRAVFATLSAVTIAWTFRAAHSEIFPNAIIGARVVSIGIGILFLAGGLIPAIFLRERYNVLSAKQARQRVLPSFKIVMHNQPFRILVSLTFVIILGTVTFNSLGIYVTTYYVCGGIVKNAATLIGLTGTIGLVASLIIIPLVTILSKKMGKIATLRVCMVCGIIGALAKWFVYDPRWPYAQLIMPFMLAPAGAGFWLLVNSMKADICDIDELETGIRREGAYASISAWVQKFTAALTFSISGFLLVVIGFDQSLGGNQAPNTLLAMRVFFSIAPVCAFVGAIILLSRYKLDAEKMDDVRAQLEARRNKV